MVTKSYGGVAADTRDQDDMETNQGGRGFHQTQCADPGNQGYRIYLIQTTIAESHKADFPKMAGYLLHMDKQVVGNRQWHQEITDSNRNPNDQEKAAKAQQIRENFPWLEKDTGNDLEIYLTHRNVQIWFMYIQRNKNISFKGDKNPPKSGIRQTRKHGEGGLKENLQNKIQTVYGYMEN